MCGISGIMHLDPCRPVDALLLQRMNDTMRHRGPDGDGVYLGDGVGLAHRRLAIIDLCTGEQPMGTEDGALQVVFNGEIYNFQELRRDLEGHGHRFRTRSDTESILHAYRQWGEAFVERLRGMFSIALWDRRERKLLLIRDRVGKKPLYYHFDGRRLVFASELKALLVDATIPRELNPAALDAYLSFGYVPSPLSIYRQIRKLPPAHLAVCTPHGLTLRSYWDLEMNPGAEPVAAERAMEELREVFDEAVRLRMISDVPLGAFLSGGVDSSAVVASMAANMTGGSIKTAAIGFSDKRFNELDHARVMAKRYGTEHREFVVQPEAAKVLERITWHLDEPFADSSAIPTWYVCQMARRQVTVALSGDGGDENFAGYSDRYLMNRFEDGLRRRLPASLRSALLGPLAALYPRADFFPRPLRLKRFLGNLALPPEEAYFRDMSFYFRPEAKARLLRPEMAAAMGQGENQRSFTAHFDRTGHWDATSRVQYVDIKTYLPEDILVKVDRMSMAHSLEVRAPLLDHKVMECAARLPVGLKLHGREAKYIFKKMNETRLPAEILTRKKQGFCFPLSSWLRTDLRETAREAVFGSASDLRTWFDMEYVRGLWERHQTGREDNGTPLWGLVMLGMWRKTVDEPAARGD